ncbi:hypothetical protein [Nitrosospira briensis]|uniref:hypothetical protein n=1 Tax=Nitrosospira briensis TaxID=35799 RepID=UPI000469AFFF|nr:hypothetical protein [Nitrosospira briensis]
MTDQKTMKRIQIFKDWTDTLAFMLWFIQTGLIIIILIKPYWAGIHGHPAFQALELIVNTIYSLQLSIHIGWIIALVVLAIIAGVSIQSHLLRPQKTETIEFVSTRPFYSYSRSWFLFLLTFSASLFTNTTSFDYIQKENLSTISAILGIIAFAAAGNCLYLLIPGARTRIQLIRTVGNKGNRIVIFNGVIFPSIQTYLPQHILAAQIKRDFFWIFTFTNNVDIELKDGKTLVLVAPGSLLETRLFPNIMNPLIVDGKITNQR